MKLLCSHCDLDSIFSLLANKFYNLGFDKTISTNYGERGEHETLKTMGKDDLVVYTDFTPDAEAREIIQNNGIKFEIHDHHESQVNDINEWMKSYSNGFYNYDVEKCGSKIYYDYLKSKGYESNSVLDEFVELVNTYDLWHKDSPLWEKAQNLNRLLFKMINWAKKDSAEKFDFFIDGVIWKCNNMKHYEFSEFEQKKIDADIKQEDDLFNEFVNKKRLIKTRKDEKGNYFAIIKLQKKVSSICNRLLEKYKGLSYIICINDYDKENPKISVRSKDDFNILVFNEVKGHENAGGWENPTQQISEDLWDNKVHGLTYRLED